MDDVLLAEGLGAVVVDVDQRLGARRRRAEDLCTAGHHLCIGMSDERAADRGEGTWREHVVGVEEPHDVSRRQRDPAVDRVVETTIRATLDPQVGLATKELQRVVRGPAVHHDVLEVRPPLRADARQRL